MDRLATATPDSRDRVVDVARALCIVVVAVWHWALSVTFRTGDGGLGMANPVHVVPAGWLLTWVFQVMPAFFLAGGYVNLVGWQRRRTGGAWRFVRRRWGRLLRPTLVWALVWLAAEAVAFALPGEHRWIWQWFPGYLAPLWFLAVYAALIALVPLTAPLHERCGAGALIALAALIAAGSVAARGGGWPVATWVTAALVWIFAHQLGYAWRSWRLGDRPVVQRLAVAVAGLGALTALTTLGGYPRAMVSTVARPESNIFPTNATIAALATFQLGLLVVAAPALQRLLRRGWAWKPVVLVNAYAMTIFVWHMTALLLVIWAYEALGGVLPDAPTAAWWAQRPLWLLAPAVILVGLVAVFGRFESRPRRSGSP